MKFWKLSSFLLIAISAYSAEFQYFGSEIDFWNKKVDAVIPEKTSSPVEEAKFPWPKYLDPKNKEFFKEGEHTPPEPFMEIVRNPSDENLRLWFSYIDKKNELANRLQGKIQDYVSRHGLAPTAEKNILVTAEESLPKISELTKRFRFRMYFDSKCPHCQKMMGTLTDLQEKGFLVEVRQIDGGETPEVPFPIVRAHAKEIKEKDVATVPLLLIGDLKRKLVYRMTGFQSVQDVLSVLQKERGA